MSEAREELARWAAGRDGIVRAEKEPGESEPEPEVPELEPAEHPELIAKLRQVNHRSRSDGTLK
ncbi:hypothetical protein [Actinacidiphila oryziradicis]|uniref:hypothetical protein n=1 Tax=Actinacidiphila oryziradicis TaxID=2571141 RepID=UPI0023F29B26|nr:hypothetical protein [Actinacidiphila oryziradicis]MCW2872212.1 hypothetical protein [Actinacidiphila oryziradicis]